MIIDKHIKIKLNNKNKKYYKNKGYLINNEYLNVDVKDLPRYSRIEVNVKCDNCDIEKKVKYSDYMTVFNKKNKYYCSKCKQESIKVGVKNKYGVDNVFQNENIKEKIKKTNIEKYGVEFAIQNEEILKKQQETNFKKYGCKFATQNEEVLKKQQETNIEKYGTKYSFLNEDVKEKIKKTNIEKYGFDHHFKNKDIQNKSIYTKAINLIGSKYEKENIININSDNYIIHCDICNNNFEISSQNFRNRLKYKTILCTICNPLNSYYNSGFEIELQNYISENYNNDIILNSKNIISPNELDIYLPDLKIAFEFNGLWWHNELYKEKNYHLNKTEKCEKNGIQLIHIYEDDWLYKKNIIKSMILNKLGKSNKIYARKTQIKEIKNNKIIRDFLNENHIQGFIGSKIKLGLYYEDELVSLMTFGKRRLAMGKKETHNNEYELIRFCNKLNINVVGGASKLFKYFINNYQPKEITTYADRTYSQGKLYEALGFKYQGKTQPNYYYVIDGIRNYRFNYRKDILIKKGFDPKKSEHEIMLDRKIYRIYDSGNLKYCFL